MASEVCNGRRIVLEAVIDRDVRFLAESQIGGPDWTLERQWGCTEWMARGCHVLPNYFASLSEEIRAWLIDKTSAEQSKSTGYKT